MHIIAPIIFCLHKNIPNIIGPNVSNPHSNTAIKITGYLINLLIFLSFTISSEFSTKIVTIKSITISIIISLIFHSLYF